MAEGVKWEPAVLLYGLSGAVALAVSFGLPWDKTMVAAAMTIATALAGAVTAFLTRPFSVSVTVGLVTTAVTAASAFGLNLTVDQLGSLGAVVSVILALVMRQALTPKAALPPAP